MPKFDVHRIVDITRGLDDCVASPRDPYRMIRTDTTFTLVYPIHARDIAAARTIAAHMESHHTGLPVVPGERPYVQHVLKGKRVSARLLVTPHVPVAADQETAAHD